MTTLSTDIRYPPASIGNYWRFAVRFFGEGSHPAIYLEDIAHHATKGGFEPMRMHHDDVTTQMWTGYFVQLMQKKEREETANDT